METPWRILMLVMGVSAGGCELQSKVCAKASLDGDHIVIDVSRGRRCEAPISLARHGRGQFYTEGGERLWVFQANEPLEFSRLTFGVPPANAENVFWNGDAPGEVLRGKKLLFTVSPNDESPLFLVP